jgi:hypothetical protein
MEPIFSAARLPAEHMLGGGNSLYFSREATFRDVENRLYNRHLTLWITAQPEYHACLNFEPRLSKKAFRAFSAIAPGRSCTSRQRDVSGKDWQ